jgi:hypothetical protein
MPNDAQMQSRARSVGSKVQQEDGISYAVRAIEDLVGKGDKAARGSFSAASV